MQFVCFSNWYLAAFRKCLQFRVDKNDPQKVSFDFHRSFFKWVKIAPVNLIDFSPTKINFPRFPGNEIDTFFIYCEFLLENVYSDGVFFAVKSKDTCRSVNYGFGGKIYFLTE